MKSVIVTKEDLHFGGLGFEQGVYARVRRRIEKRNSLIAKQGIGPINAIEERNILIGEVGELAFRKYLLSRGNLQVIDDSWSQFNRNNGFENVIDLAVHDGLRQINYQVKSSESGRRSIKIETLVKCIESPLHFMAFVAVRGLYAKDGSISFECRVTSQMSPRHIPRLATWKLQNGIYSHVENEDFIPEWLQGSENYQHQKKRAR